jgi:GT2 family glycosyltransferase
MVAPFSIVIPTYRRGSMLRQTLPSYLETDPNEVVIVDDASGPPHDGMLDQLTADPRVRVIRLHRHGGQQEAKNEGASAARNEWIVFGEDDVWFTPEYPATLIGHASQADAQVASGSAPFIEPHLLSRPRELNDAIRSDRSIGQHPPDSFLGLAWRVEVLPSGDIVTPLLPAVAAVHSSVFDRVRFDPRFRGNAFREETDFFLSCSEAGFRTIRCPHAMCGHMKTHGSALPGGSWTMGHVRYAAQMLSNNWLLLRKHAHLFRGVAEGTEGSQGLLSLQWAFGRSMVRRLVRPGH